MPELAPCPKCSSTNVIPIIVNVDDRAVACDDCYHRGPTRRSKRAAENGWNRSARTGATRVTVPKGTTDGE